MKIFRFRTLALSTAVPGNDFCFLLLENYSRKCKSKFLSGNRFSFSTDRPSKNVIKCSEIAKFWI